MSATGNLSLLEPTLSIGIPTFNRLHWLRMTLPELLKQAVHLPTDSIEVLVSDNCSTDDTWAYLLSLAQDYPLLRLHRNETNVGGEGNFYLIPGLARGRYVYMVGDDDLLEPGALDRLLKVLERKPDYVAINIAVYDDQLANCLNTNFLGVVGDRALSGVDQFLKYVHPMAAGFIGAIAAKREFFRSISEDDYRHFAQWGVSIQAERYVGIASFSEGFLIATPGLRARRNADLGCDYLRWFLQGSALALEFGLKNGCISTSDVAARKKWLIRHIATKRILFERASGTFRLREAMQVLKPNFKDTTMFWLLCLPAMLLPGVGVIASAALRFKRYRQARRPSAV